MAYYDISVTSKKVDFEIYEDYYPYYYRIYIRTGMIGTGGTEVYDSGWVLQSNGYTTYTTVNGLDPDSVYTCRVWLNISPQTGEQEDLGATQFTTPSADVIATLVYKQPNGTTIASSTVVCDSSGSFSTALRSTKPTYNGTDSHNNHAFVGWYLSSASTHYAAGGTFSGTITKNTTYTFYANYYHYDLTSSVDKASVTATVDGTINYGSVSIVAWYKNSTWGQSGGTSYNFTASSVGNYTIYFTYKANGTQYTSTTTTAYVSEIPTGDVYCKIYYNGKWCNAIAWIYNGSAWKKTIPWIYNGSTWKKGVSS